MPVTIEKLSLRVVGVSRSEGERLAEAVANELAAARNLAATGGIGSLRVRLAPQPGLAASELSSAIAAEILRAIEAAQ